MYFKDFGLWVAHAAEAVHFASQERAREFVQAEHMTDVALRDAAELSSAGGTILFAP